MSILFKPYYLGCLAHASYLIGDAGKAVVIDPRRDVDEYIRDAEAAGYKIVGVIETHLHADFVSGHIELREKTGGTIYVSHLAKAEYEHNAVKEGDVIELGKLRLEILETPGHTPESISVLAYVDGVPTYLFTGDMLFIGEIGRPDLVGWRGVSRDEMAHMMYRTLRDKVLPLPDSVEIWPAHGAGSTCGKAISDEPSAPLGRQRTENWGLRMVATGDEDGFVAALTEGLPSIPPYFPHDVLTNRSGAKTVQEAMSGARAFSADQVAALMREGVIALDVRDCHAFAAGHIPGSISVPLEGSFAPWLGAVVPSKQRYVVVVPDGTEQETLIRMARVGYDPVEGWLEGGMDAWKASGREVASFPEISAEELRARMGTVKVLDVRSEGEYRTGHIEGSKNIPLLTLKDRLQEVPSEPLIVMCHTGYRSSIACSILEGADRKPLTNLRGGWSAWEESQPVAR